MESKLICIVIMLGILMVSCQQPKNNVKDHESNSTIILNDTLQMDDSLVNVIEDYIDEYNIHEYIHDNLLYQLLIEKSDSSGTEFIMTILSFQNDFMKYFPFGHIKIGNNTVYISSICNNPFKIDTTTQFVKKAMRGKNRLLSSPDQMQGIREYSSWKISMYKDTIIIDKHGITPYIPKKGNAKFIPPVIK